MKVYLDDVRDAPKGWVRTYTVAETIKLLQTGKVQELSLDHDLGATDPNNDGNVVMTWIEGNVAHLQETWFVPDVIVFHTDNPVGRQKMQRALLSILRMKKGIDDKKI